MGVKLSDGFAGATTRQFKGLIHEVELRMSRNDPFKEQFSGDGVFEGSAGQDFSKRQAPYQDYHTNYPSGFNRKDTPQFKMEADGNQEALDFLDELENKIQSPVKNPYDQFPGAYQDHVKKSDNGQLDPHQVDPRQMRGKMNHSVGPEAFHKAIEHRMKRLSSDELIRSINEGKNKINIYRYPSGKGYMYCYKIENGSSPGYESSGFNSAAEAFQDAKGHTSNTLNKLSFMGNGFNKIYG